MYSRKDIAGDLAAVLFISILFGIMFAVVFSGNLTEVLSILKYYISPIK